MPSIANKQSIYIYKSSNVFAAHADVLVSVFSPLT